MLKWLLVFVPITIALEFLKPDAQTWISKSKGLPLKTEEDIDTGGGDKRHMSIRYEYSNVRPPAGVQ